jgi:hypothetical protein
MGSGSGSHARALSSFAPANEPASLDALFASADPLPIAPQHLGIEKTYPSDVVAGGAAPAGVRHYFLRGQ